MKTKILKSILVLMCVFCVACSSNNTLTGNETGLDDDGTTSITVIGNPSVDVDADAQVYLTLNQDVNNLKKVTAYDLKDVLSLEEETVTSNAEVPAVSNFVMGPNAELAIVFENPVFIEDKECVLLFAKDDEKVCVYDKVLQIDGKPQFDENSNVYFHVTDISTEEEQLIKWDQGTEVQTQLSNQNNDPTQWLVHANGTVYMIGEVNGVAYFRSIAKDGTVTNLLPDATITKMNFVDEDVMIIQGENVEFDNALRAGNFLYRMTDNVIIKQLSYSSGDLETVQYDSLHHIYLLDGAAVYKVHPGPVEKIDVSDVSLYKIYNDVLYAATTTGLVKYELDSSSSETIIESVDIYHLASDGDAIFFDGLNKENKVYVGYWNFVDAGTAQIEEISKGLVQLESADSANNNSFLKRDLNATGPHALVRAALPGQLTSPDTRILEDVSASVNFSIENNRERRVTPGKFVFSIDSAGELNAQKTKLSTVYQITADSSDPHGLDKYMLERIVLLNEAQSLVGVVGVRKMDNAKMFKTYSFTIDEIHKTVSFSHVKTISLPDKTYSVYASPTLNRFYLLTRNGQLTAFDNDLTPLANNQVYFSEGTVSLVSETGGYLFVRNVNVTDIGIHESGLMVLEPDDLEHIQTIPVKRNNHILNTFQYDPETIVVRMYSFTTETPEFYIFE